MPRAYTQQPRGISAKYLCRRGGTRACRYSTPRATCSRIFRMHSLGTGARMNRSVSVDIIESDAATGRGKDGVPNRGTRGVGKGWGGRRGHEVTGGECEMAVEQKWGACGALLHQTMPHHGGSTPSDESSTCLVDAMGSTDATTTRAPSPPPPHTHTHLHTHAHPPYPHEHITPTPSTWQPQGTNIVRPLPALGVTQSRPTGTQTGQTRSGGRRGSRRHL
jgi:hypothetical protein